MGFGRSDDKFRMALGKSDEENFLFCVEEIIGLVDIPTSYIKYFPSIFG